MTNKKRVTVVLLSVLLSVGCLYAESNDNKERMKGLIMSAKSNTEYVVQMRDIINEKKSTYPRSEELYTLIQEYYTLEIEALKENRERVLIKSELPR